MGPSPDPALLEPFIIAAKELEGRGVRVTNDELRIPRGFSAGARRSGSVSVLAPALSQVPMVSQMVGPSSSVGILTERPNLTERHCYRLEFGLTWRPRERALPPNAVFPTAFIYGAQEADVEVLRAERVQAAQDRVQRRPDTGAIVLECTKFAPFQRYGVNGHWFLPAAGQLTCPLSIFAAAYGQSFVVRLE